MHDREVDTSRNPPELRDFGITPEEYALYTGTGSVSDNAGLGCVLMIIVGFTVGFPISFVVTRNIGDALTWGIAGAFFMPLLLAFHGFYTFFDSCIVLFRKSRLLKSPVACRIKLYEEADKAHREAYIARRKTEQARQEAERIQRRGLYEHWMSLTGEEFEEELGILYRHLGYRVESTPSSGDQGIDLILIKNSKTTIVQCKSHRSPVGPAVVRELFGSLIASGADGAILACTGGFTKGVHEFVRGKPITLISASELAVLASRAEDKPQDTTDGPPICPMPGCAQIMVSRTGRRGKFWGCPRFPRCRGARDI